MKRKDVEQLYIDIAKEMHRLHNEKPSSEWRKTANHSAMLVYDNVYHVLQSILFPNHEGTIKVNVETGKVTL